MTTMLLDRATPIVDDATRRQFLAGLAAAGLLTGCGAGGQDRSPAAATPGAGWSFTDDLGTTIELDTPPERIVAFTSAAGGLWDLGVRPVGVWGPHRLPDGSPDPQVGDVDLDAVGSAGNDYEVDIEALAALRPHLIVAPTFSEDAYSAFDAEAVDEIKSIAPIVGISHVGKPFDQVLARWVELAAALGADLNAPQVVRDRERFDDATAALAAATAAKPGLKAMFVAGTSDTLYVVHPRADSPVWLYDEAGLDVVVPNVAIADYWEALSWEQVSRHPVDLIFHSVRTGSLSREELLVQPTFAALPAARAGQLAPWRLDAPISHRRYTEIIEEITAAVTASAPDVV